MKIAKNNSRDIPGVISLLVFVTFVEVEFLKRIYIDDVIVNIVNYFVNNESLQKFQGSIQKCHYSCDDEKCFGLFHIVTPPLCNSL